MPEMITESCFYMWRAVFAMAHADHVVTPEEKSYLYNVLGSYPFLSAQRETLENDMSVPQDPALMFEKISSQEDRSRFFYYARALVWCDGDFGEQEQKIMITLKKSHIETANHDSLDNSMQFELDDNDKIAVRLEHARMVGVRKKSLWQKLFG